MADKYDGQLGVELELEKEKEQVTFWKKSFDEELAHSKQAEEKVNELFVENEKLKEASNVTRESLEWEQDMKDYTSPNLLVEQLSERIKELEKEKEKMGALDTALDITTGALEGSQAVVRNLESCFETLVKAIEKHRSSFYTEIDKLDGLNDKELYGAFEEVTK